MSTGTIPLAVGESILLLLKTDALVTDFPGDKDMDIDLDTLEYQFHEPGQPKKTDSSNIYITSNQPGNNDGLISGPGGDGYNWNFIGGLVIGQLSVFMIMVIFIRFFIFADSSSSQDYPTHLRQNRRPKILPSNVATTEKILEKTYYNVDSHPSETLDWFSVLVAQAISQVREDVRTNENIIKSLNDAFISIGNMPKFLDKIEVTELNIGDNFPIFSNCRISPSDDDPTRLEAQIDVDLRDNITLGIMTKLLMNYPKALFAVLPVALSVSVKRFSGTLTVSLRTLTTTTTTTTTTVPTNAEANAPLQPAKSTTQKQPSSNSETPLLHTSSSASTPTSSSLSSSTGLPSSSSSSSSSPPLSSSSTSSMPLTTINSLKTGENKSRSILKESNIASGSLKSNPNNLNNNAPGSSSSSNSNGSASVNIIGSHNNNNIGTSITTTVNEKTYLTFSFSSDYILEFAINSSIGSKSKTQLLNLPKIGRMVESRLHKWFIDRCVEPRYQQVPLPSFWPRKKTTKEKDQNISSVSLHNNNGTSTGNIVNSNPSSSHNNNGGSSGSTGNSSGGNSTLTPTSAGSSAATTPSTLITTTTTTTTTTATSLSPMTRPSGVSMQDRSHRYSMNYGLSPVSNVTMALGPGPDDMDLSRSLRNRRVSSIGRHR